jgi:hypothetical protein
MNKVVLVVLSMCFAGFVAGCGPKASTTEGTTPGPEGTLTEVEDVEDEVEPEQTTEETAEDEDEDEEMAPPEG